MATLLVFGLLFGLLIFVLWDKGQLQDEADRKGVGQSIVSRAKPKPDMPIDMTNAAHIGFIIGLMEGTVEEAAIARLALQRFEQQHGRKATFREVGLVIGLMKSLKS